MNLRSVILVGVPDSGKTNFLGRLWETLRNKKGKLLCPSPPNNIKYLEEVVAHLHKGNFAPRSDKAREELRKDVTLPVRMTDSNSNDVVEVVVPDVSGELWNKVVDTLEIPQEWMEELERSSGAMLFVRVHSELNINPLDWVTTRKLLRQENELPPDEDKIPTQVILSELLRFLELKLRHHADGSKPRVAIIVSAWDLLDPETSAKGPSAFLRAQFPLFAGRIKGERKLDVRAFGVSIVGGDFLDQDFQSKYLRGDPDTAGFVVAETEEGSTIVSDITLPMAWLIGGQ